ncbi:intradiol ring-cleavage dioxygenase [Parathalassolituus penaei]|uniref:Intradiol ring-cleavage dioxygenase n=1 Tax=Parathalassolituus penaei TaxID=2997323 RepID=A0A9X3IU24_9GAMM|nr:intradiol ring-cleavage dioxygenase [Parathalassolituus penaei]MCY0965738.1 intradiol ring-cleavage dioxygenase [Parathalassolituus penaei]
MQRRRFLTLAGRYLLATPLLSLPACGGSSGSSVVSSTSDSSSDTSTDTDSSTDTSTDTSSSGWATGGTSSISVEYENPFADGNGDVCVLTEATTEGPCYSGTEDREDISEGRDGLPLRLCFRIVDSNCEPVEGAILDIWHCDPYGVYSGDDMTAVNFCTGGDSYYTSNNFFRGRQTSDADGLVWFSTCFPGWYASRAVHIHFKVMVGSRTWVTSQVCFDDSLCDEILANEPVYSSHGEPDTHNYDDTVFPSSGYEEYMMSTEQMSDGSMLAWKALMINA